ncbi:MAG: S41 family peptidase [Chloroflexota bacterium]
MTFPDSNPDERGTADRPSAPSVNTERVPSTHEPSAEPAPTTAVNGPIHRSAGSRRSRAVGVVLGIALFTGGILVGRLDGAAAAPTIAPQATETVAASSGGGSPAASASGDSFALIKQAWDLLHTQYVGRSELKDKDLAYGAIQGLTEAVGDTGHTSFETPEEIKLDESALQGQYVGIGALVDEVEGKPQIQGVFPGSPAANAGLGAGDAILEIDGKTTTDLSFEQVSALIRGAEGTKVTLRVDPAGAPEAKDVTLTRTKVTIPAVEWAMVPGTDTADIRVLQFSSGTTQKVVDALNAAKEKGAKRVLLDLRQNPGGFVDDAVGVASQFLKPDATVYVTEDANGAKTPVKARPNGVATDLPLVVLVDRSTASSAEIVASALKDAGRAKVVGEQTFGTGTVLARFDLADGSALRIGTIRWLTASGQPIWHTGLVPEQTVALPDGVHPLDPTAVERLGPTGVAAATDSQFLAGLRALGWQGAAAG